MNPKILLLTATLMVGEVCPLGSYLQEHKNLPLLDSSFCLSTSYISDSHNTHQVVVSFNILATNEMLIYNVGFAI